MQLSGRELLIRFRHRPAISLDLDYDKLIATLLGPSRRDGQYHGPVPSQDKFINDSAKWKAFKGMAGVAKTSTGVCSMILRALFQPNFKGVIARYDYNKLIGTTAVRFFEMINRLNPELIIDRDKTPPMAVYINQPGGIGISQIDFIGLKDYPGSYEWHRGFIDEADECDRSIVETFKTRMRAQCEPEYEGDLGLDMAFNPPDKDHWIYTACTGKDGNDKKVQEPTFKLFEPKVGENDHNLPPEYFTEHFKGMTEDELQRLKYGNWGASFKGEGVFKGAFSSGYHVKEKLHFDDEYLTFIFLDFGFRHPAAIWTQLDDKFRLRILADYLGENEEAKQFITQVKAQTKIKFPSLRQTPYYIGDPAAKQKKDTGSTLQVLEAEGVNLMYMEGMTIEEGIRRIRYLLQQAPSGIPQILVSREGAPRTVRMFQGGYYKHPTTAKPVKDGTYDHIADALRYGVTNLFDADGSPIALPDADWSAAGNGHSEWPDALVME